MKEELIKFKLNECFEGRYNKEIELDFNEWSRKRKKISKKFGSKLLRTYVLTEKHKNILIGRQILAGDRLDGWANHFHYIAIKIVKKGRKWLYGKILGLHEIERGWKAPLFQKGFREWKKEILRGEE